MIGNITPGCKKKYLQGHQLHLHFVLTHGLDNPRKHSANAREHEVGAPSQPLGTLLPWVVSPTVDMPSISREQHEELSPWL